MSQQIFDKHWPLAKNGANELIPGAAILQTRDDKDEPITLAAAVQWDESSGLFLPTHKENPLEVRVRELEAKLDELKQTIESGVQLKGSIVKRTLLGTKWTFTPSEEWVLCEDYELGENTIRWGLFFKEHGRPLHEVLENLAVNVSLYQQPGSFGRVNSTFERIMYPSLEDSPLHPLAIPGDDDQQSIMNNIILYNKPFTYNLGRYLRISLINEGNFNMAISRAILVEEGYQ